MRSFIEKSKSLARMLRSRVMTLTESSGNRNSEVRILFVANASIPTLQIGFMKPLAPLVEVGTVATELLSEQQMKERFGKRLREPEVCTWLNQRLAEFKPTIVIFCRYSGPHVEHIVSQVKAEKVTVIFHIDDDLLNVPIELGQHKYDYHNHPLRLAAINYLLNHADLVYCSTEVLRKRLVALGIQSTSISGKISCFGRVLTPATLGKVRKIGYMGFDHAHDLALILPALVLFLRGNPDIQFELFGSIPKPSELDEFGDRVTTIPPVRDYESFMSEFAALGWDIGICPLAPTSFNATKSINKWVEYTSVGAAVIASAGTIYDDCCAEGRGLLANTTTEWLAALDLLMNDQNLRFNQVVKAQKHLELEYSVERLRDQVLDVFEQAHKIAKQRVEGESA